MPETLLLVDGHAGVRTALAARLMQGPGQWIVRTASTLDAAMQAVDDSAPMVLLCDPKSLSPRGAAPAVVRSLSRTGIPVVVLTSTLFGGEEEALRQAGAHDVLLKGLPLPALREVLATVLARAGGSARAG